MNRRASHAETAQRTWREALRAPCRLLRRHLAPCIVATSIATLLFMALDRRPPVRITRIGIVPPSVMAGADASTEIDVVVERECRGTLYRTLVSGALGHPTQLYDTVPIVIPMDHKEPHRIYRGFHVPHGFSAGPATFRSWLAFSCNPLQDNWPILVVAPDAPVTIELSAAEMK